MTDSRDLEPMWSVMNDQTRNTKDSVQVCSILHVAHVGVRRVTLVIVHIGHQDVVVVVDFFVAILFVNCCIRRHSLYRTRTPSLPCHRQSTRNLGQNCRKDVVGICRKHMSNFPRCNSIVQRSTQKQRTW